MHTLSEFTDIQLDEWEALPCCQWMLQAVFRPTCRLVWMQTEVRNLRSPVLGKYYGPMWNTDQTLDLRFGFVINKLQLWPNDQHSYHNSSWEHEHLNKILLQSIQQLFKYFKLENRYRVGYRFCQSPRCQILPCHGFHRTAITVANVLLYLKKNVLHCCYDYMQVEGYTRTQRAGGTYSTYYFPHYNSHSNNTKMWKVTLNVAGYKNQHKSPYLLPPKSEDWINLREMSPQQQQQQLENS